jgi:hypothetical protein
MDTDTDAAFIGEATIDGNQGTGARGRRTSNFDGEESVLLAKGGLDAHLATPVAEDDYGTLGDSQNEEETPGHGWSRSTDFDDQPWYKRPSVCLTRPV